MSEQSRSSKVSPSQNEGIPDVISVVHCHSDYPWAVEKGLLIVTGIYLEYPDKKKLDGKPAVRKISPEEAEKIRPNPLLYVPPASIEQSLWRGIEGSKRMFWIYDTIRAGGDLDFLNYFKSANPRSSINSTPEDLLADPNSDRLFECLERGEWTGVWWVMNLGDTKVSHIIFRQIWKTFLERWESSAKRLGMISWPNLVVLSEIPPSIELPSFELRLFEIDLETGDIKEK